MSRDVCLFREQPIYRLAELLTHSKKGQPLPVLLLSIHDIALLIYLYCSQTSARCGAGPRPDFHLAVFSGGEKVR